MVNGAGLRRNGFIVLLMLSMLMSVGCEGKNGIITKVFQQLSEGSEKETSETETIPSETGSGSETVQDSEEIVTRGNNPVLEHGRLEVKGTQIVDETGEAVQLKGVSTHGIQWFPDYVSLDSFRTMRDDWDINVVRLAMYTDPNVGYDESLHALVEKGVAYAVELDLYVIIDWHILSDNNPMSSKDRAIEFFDTMSKKYKDTPNVIYEICNEPNGNVTWDRDIKPYAVSVINAIRENDKDALIIVGTPTWSQDVDIVAKDPIENQENLLYALHFYAATHKDALREKLTKALELELPIFVSEFGISEASGNGGIDEEQGDIWLDLLESKGIGYVAWNLSNKNESSALIRSDVTTISDWDNSDLSPWGQWYVHRMKEKE